MKFVYKLSLVFSAIALLAAITLVNIEPASAFSGSGAGTTGDPFLITNCSELQEIEDGPNNSYLLTTSLDCSGNGRFVTYTENTYTFGGEFDGGGNTLTVDIDFGIFDQAAVFPRAIDATISDLTINGSVAGGYSNGALIGYADDVVVTNVISNANVSGGSYIGGLIGEVFDSTITGSSATGTVTGSEEIVGGLIGESQRNTISNSFATGNVTAVGDYVGGLIGEAEDTDIENSYATGDVEGDRAVGGLTGASNCGGSVTDSYATGDVTAEGSRVGGLSGEAVCEGPGATYTNTYATGAVDGEDLVGGLIGSSYAPVFQSYATGTVSGGDNVGGLIGEAWGFGFDDGFPIIAESFATGAVTGTGSGPAGGLLGVAVGDMPIIESYSRSSVTSTGSVGGLVGDTENDTIIIDSYATGALSGDVEGGLVGEDTGLGGAEVDFSFWDTQSTGAPTSEYGTGKTTAQMKNLNTFTTDLGDDSWDFDDTWGITSGVNDGYPCLQWVSESCVTEEPAPDDNDGIDAEVEDAAPNGGDGNNDGTPDSEQSNVVSFESPITGQYVTVALNDDCELQEATVTSEGTKPVADVAFDYPVGFVGFSANCTTDAEVTVRFWNLEDASFVARKFNPNTNAYFTVEGATITQGELDLLKYVDVSYVVVDNGILDFDPTSGAITDPISLGQVIVGAPRTGVGGTS